MEVSTEKSEVEMLDIFSGVQKELDNELDLREKIRLHVLELEQIARGISTSMQAVHQCPRDQVPALCQKLQPMFDPARTVFQSLSDIILQDMYFKYNEQWRNVCQKLAFLSSLLIYLESNTLASREQVGQHLGVAVDSQKGMHLELDDYLVGLLSMCNELSRLAVNSVILGDFSRPFEIATFTSDLMAGFRLLNLKNDFLRKKYDSLKYDIKKIEEVVYDISIRGLKPPSATV